MVGTSNFDILVPEVAIDFQATAHHSEGGASLLKQSGCRRRKVGPWGMQW